AIYVSCSCSSVAFRYRFQLQRRSGPHVGRHLDGQSERKIPSLRDEKHICAFLHTHLRYATLVGERLVWVHDDTSTGEGRLSIFVDSLDRYPTLGVTDNADSKTDGSLSVRHRGIRSLGPDAPRVEARPRRRFKFDLCTV